MDALKTLNSHELWLAFQALDKTALSYDLLRATAALSIGYVIIKCIYNRYFHPLAKFPGPFLASITEFYHIYLYLTVAAEHIVDEELHRKYGPVVRKAPNFLIINDASMIPVVYSKNAWKPDMFYVPEGFGRTNVPVAFFQKDPKEHTISRRRITPPFSPKSMTAMKPIIQTRVSEWTAKNKKYADSGKAIDWTEWTQALAYDVLSELVFGEPFGFIATESDVHGLLREFYQAIPYAGTLVRLPWLVKWITSLPFAGAMLPDPSDKRGMGKIMGIRDAHINHRLQNPTNKPDILNHLLSYKNEDGSPIPLPVIKFEALVMMNAGSETTASTLCCFVLNILRFPHIYKKLMAGDLSTENISSPDPQFRYLSAVIKETLRWTHPAPSLFPRLISGNGVVLPDGRHIPAGAVVNINIQLAMRDKKVFGEDAEEFVPERWLVESGWGSPEAIKHMEQYNFVWGYGPRMCVGKPLAEAELLMATKELLVNFVPELVNPEKPYSRMTNYTTIVHEGFYIRLRNRTEA